MDTVIINGSPRKNGETSRLIEVFAHEVGGTLTILHTYYLNISPCLDCRHCWENEGCRIDDDMQDLYEAILNADNIIISSPVYFTELSGSILNFFTRFQYIWVAKNIKKREFPIKSKKGILLLTAGGNGDISPAIAMGKRLLRLVGADFYRLISLIGSDVKDENFAKNKKLAVSEIKKLADHLKS